MAWTTLVLLENWWLSNYLGQNHLGFFQMGKKLLDAFLNCWVIIAATIAPKTHVEQIFPE
jgi:hypothetical protein